MNKSADLTLVDNSVTYLQQLISHPAAMFDHFATLAALEQVMNVAREKGTIVPRSIQLYSGNANHYPTAMLYSRF